MYPFQNVLAIIINQIAVTINRTVKSAKEIVKKNARKVYACIHVVIAMMNIFDGRYLLHQKGVWDGINRNSE